MANTHDQLFKKVISQPSEARRLIEHFISADIKEVVDLDSLELQSNSLLNEHLKEYFTDVVYHCKISKSQDAKLCFLFEHKSYPDSFLLLQVLYYLAATYRGQMENKQMALIIPIIFTHGRYNHKVVDLADVFELPSAKFAAYLPTYKYELINVHNLTEADLAPIRDSYLLSMLIAFQARGNKRLLLPRIREMFKFVEQIKDVSLRKSFVKALATYLVAYFKLKNEDMVVIREALPPIAEKPFFSTADRLRAEGLAEGLMVGKKLNNIDKNIEVTVNLLINLSELGDKTIAKIAAVDLDFVHAVRRTFSQRLIKKRREHFYQFYAEIDNFDKKYKKHATELFEKLRKDIRKAKVKIAPPPQK